MSLLQFLGDTRVIAMEINAMSAIVTVDVNRSHASSGSILGSPLPRIFSTVGEDGVGGFEINTSEVVVKSIGIRPKSDAISIFAELLVEIQVNSGGSHGILILGRWGLEPTKLRADLVIPLSANLVFHVSIKSVIAGEVST